MVKNLQSKGHDVVVLSVTPTHVHILVLLPDDVTQIKTIIGWCKWFGTRAARKVDPSLSDVEMWAEGETYKPIDSFEHHAAAVGYILKQQGADAFVWSKERLGN